MPWWTPPLRQPVQLVAAALDGREAQAPRLRQQRQLQPALHQQRAHLLAPLPQHLRHRVHPIDHPLVHAPAPCAPDSQAAMSSRIACAAAAGSAASRIGRPTTI